MTMPDIFADTVVILGLFAAHSTHNNIKNGCQFQIKAAVHRHNLGRAASCLTATEPPKAAATFCPLSRGNGSVHGSICKAYPLRIFKPMRLLSVGSNFLSFEVNKPTVGVGSRHRPDV